jgi:hypothetical protein
MNSEGALGGSEGEGGSDEEPELMDASELAGEASFLLLLITGAFLLDLLLVGTEDDAGCVLYGASCPFLSC